MSEYPVDPETISQRLMRDVKPEKFTTGFISQTLYYSKQSTHRIIAEYRPPQMTGLWFDGSDEPVKVPLPGLVLIADCTGRHATYRVVAVKKRPQAMDEDIFDAPLPNVTQGNICWGSTARMPLDENVPDLSAIWMSFFSTPFGNHGVDSKSTQRKYAHDVRVLLIDLAQRKARTYPTATLVGIGKLRKFL